jgi:Fur family zinc uptake transcriptional regulator
MGKIMTETGSGWSGRHDHNSCVADAIETAEKLCREHGTRLTPLRRKVLELIWSSHRPIGAYAVLGQLRDERDNAAPPTVYRALDFLMEEGLVHRIQSLNAFVGCSEPDHAHTGMFLICAGCGDAREIEDDNLDEAIHKVAQSHGFAVQRRMVEMTGTCPGCAAKAA